MQLSIQIKNILTMYGQATQIERQAGISWYTRANDIVLYLANKYQKHPAQIAGIIAALSPACDWHQNLIDTINLLNLKENCKVTTYGPNKLKALKILNETNPENILKLLLHKSKVNKTAQFYRNILNPDLNGPVTIDRHTIRVNYDEILNEVFYMTLNRYLVMQQAYVLAANKTDLRPHELQAVCWVTFRRIFDVPDKNKSIRLDSVIQSILEIKSEIPF